ncbi:MAG: hypothetical protein M3O32_05060, partial [Actinomycetota bacterium]|nr:hypothetical protein [Actinomycetota bacterium]
MDWDLQKLDNAVACVYETRDRIAWSIKSRTATLNDQRRILTSNREASALRLAQLEAQLVDARRWDAESAQKIVDFERDEAPQGDYPDDETVRAHELACAALAALD